MFSASGKFSGATGSPSRGAGLPGYWEEEGRYVPGRLRRRDEPAGKGLFQEEEGCCFQSRPALGGDRADRGKEVSGEAEDVRFRIGGGPSGCPRYRGLSRAEAAGRPCGCRGSADGEKVAVFHDGPPLKEEAGMACISVRRCPRSGGGPEGPSWTMPSLHRI